jgi:hypothetical protein
MVTVAGDTAVVVVSCLVLGRDACLASQEEVQLVLVGSYQEVEAAPVSVKKTPCWQHWGYEDYS